MRRLYQLRLVTNARKRQLSGSHASSELRMTECPITLIEEKWCSHCTGALLPSDLREGERPPRFPSYDTLEAKATKAFVKAVKDERKRERAKGLHR